MSWEKVENDINRGPGGLFKWVAIAVIAVAGLFAAINWVGAPASKAVERAVMKNSFQYREGMEQRAAILEANIAEIDAMLQTNPANRDDLIRQRQVLQVQLKAITINE